MAWLGLDLTVVSSACAHTPRGINECGLVTHQVTRKMRNEKWDAALQITTQKHINWSVGFKISQIWHR